MLVACRVRVWISKRLCARGKWSNGEMRWWRIICKINVVNFMFTHVHPHFFLLEFQSRLDELLWAFDEKSESDCWRCCNGNTFFPALKMDGKKRAEKFAWNIMFFTKNNFSSWAMSSTWGRKKKEKKMLSVWKMMLINLIKYRIFKYLENHMLHDTFVSPTWR